MNQQRAHMQPMATPDSSFSFNGGSSIQRVAELLQTAENVVQGGSAPPTINQDPLQDAFEPTPIAPTGVRVVPEVASSSFEDVFLSRTFMNMPGQASFPKSNAEKMASSLPQQQSMFGNNNIIQQSAQRMFLQQHLQQQQMQLQQQQMQMQQQMQSSMQQQQQMIQMPPSMQMQQQQMQQHHSFGFAPMNAPSLSNNKNNKYQSKNKNLATTAALLSASPKKSVGPARKDPPKRTRKYQTGQWQERYQELLKFRQDNGHLFVPHSYPDNQKLAQWVKRQRYQYKLKHSGHHSTLSDEREDLLGSVGFIWDSHAACWQEHFQSLEAFFMSHGHCNVPSDHPDSSLSVWSKHQRRQLKRFKAGLSSTMTEERFQCLESLGFDWNPRNLKNF